MTTLVRGAFEYQGQKCSAASRAYLPRLAVGSRSRTSWSPPRRSLAVRRRVRGPVAVRRRGDRLPRGGQAPRRVRPGRSRPSVSFLTGGEIDDSAGYFVRPTILECADPADEVFTTEYFGPILAVHVYEDAHYAGDAHPGRRRRAVRADRRDPRHRPHRDRRGHGGAAVQRRATSTSTTSRPARSSASSRSAAPGPAAPTTRRARCSTSSAGSPPGRSRRRSPRPPTTVIRTWARTDVRAGSGWSGMVLSAPLSELVSVHIESRLVQGVRLPVKAPGA